MLEANAPQLLNMMSYAFLAAFHHVIEGIQKTQSDILQQFRDFLLMSKEMRIELARKLMESTEPKVIELKPGEIKRIDEDLIIEKTPEGEIRVYVIIEE